MSAAVEEIKDLIEEQGKGIKHLQKRYDELNGALRADVDEILKKQNRPNFGGGERACNVNPEHTKAFDRWARKGDISGLLAIYDESETKGMQVGTDPDGGYLVPQYMSDSITKKIFDQSPIRQIARVEPMDHGSTFEEILDHDDLDAEWVAETGTRAETAAPNIGVASIEVHEMHASPRATQKIIDDSKIDIGRWLVERVADKFARTEGIAFVSGNGVGKPRGFTTYDTAATGDATRAWGTMQHVVTGAAADFAASSPGDALIGLTEELRTPYRANAVWVMNRATAKKLRQFKEASTNAYLWEFSLQQGRPDRLLGYPVHIDDNMPDVGANAYPIAFGDFKQGYCIPERLGIRTLRDPYTARPHVVFYTIKRVGGAVLNSEAIKLLKCST